MVHMARMVSSSSTFRVAQEWGFTQEERTMVRKTIQLLGASEQRMRR